MWWVRLLSFEVLSGSICQAAKINEDGLQGLPQARKGFKGTKPPN